MGDVEVCFAFVSGGEEPREAPRLLAGTCETKPPLRRAARGAVWGRAQQTAGAAVFSTFRPNNGRRCTPRALPANAAGSHSQACRLPEMMPLK